VLRLSPAVRLQTSRSLLQLDDVANRRRTSARGAHRYVVSPETDLLRIVGSVVTPERVQNPTEPTSERDDRDLPATPIRHGPSPRA